MRLDGLHEDIQSCILSFLDPSDILVLRKTCQTYYYVTSQRTVWIHALRRVCTRNSIFMQTFPIENMSLLQLEYAAMGPENWGRLSCTCIGEPDSEEGAEVDVREPHSSIFINLDMVPLNNTIREVFLVPGGRYFVTVSESMLLVWDLGLPGSQSTGAIANGKPIATESIRSYGVFLVHPTLDEKGLLIFIGVNGVKPQDTSLLFVIYPTDSDPRLQKIAEFILPPIPNFSLSLSTMTPSRIMCLLDGTVIVYDYRKDARASVDIDPKYLQVLFTESVVIAIYAEHILIWPIPPLTPNGVSTDTPKTAGPASIPPYSVPIPIQDKVITECGCICDWYTGTHQRLLFDLLDECDLSRFEIIVNEDLRYATITPLGTFSDPPETVWDLSRICNDTIVTWSRNNDHYFMITVTGISEDLDVDRTIFLSAPAPYTSYIPSSLCPFSGRLAYVDKASIRVCDYFAPPRA